MHIKVFTKGINVNERMEVCYLIRILSRIRNAFVGNCLLSGFKKTLSLSCKSLMMYACKHSCNSILQIMDLLIPIHERQIFGRCIIEGVKSLFELSIQNSQVLISESSEFTSNCWIK